MSASWMSISSIALVALAEAGEQLDRSSEGIRQTTAPFVKGTDQVDLSEQAVKLLSARASYRAALELAQTADEVAEETLDLLA
jgi:hypothetical protein